MELGCGSFVEMEWLFFLSFYLLFIANGGIITQSMPGRRILLFYAP